MVDAAAVRLYRILNDVGRDATTVVDAGCGRAAHLQHTDGAVVFTRWRSDGVRIVGLDVAAPATPNPYLSEFHLIRPSGPWPLAAASADVVFSDWVLEHVTEPVQFFSEVGRVLKPGGHLVARTLQKWSVAGIGARLVPNRLHRSLISALQPGMRPEDIFPTALQANTTAVVRRLCTDAGLQADTETRGGLDGYGGRTRVVRRLLGGVESLLPAGMHHTLLITATKRA